MRILVVDDNPDVASSLAELLKIDGCEDVAIAYDGTAALESVTAGVPDLILCDWSLPGGMDGLDLARICRKSPKVQHVRLWRSPATATPSIGLVRSKPDSMTFSSSL